MPQAQGPTVTRRGGGQDAAEAWTGGERKEGCEVNCGWTIIERPSWPLTESQKEL